MKVRTGFVSNSSSSSYVIFVKKADFDTVMSEKDLLNYISPENIQAFGMDLVKIGYVSGNYSSFEDYSGTADLSETDQGALDDNGADGVFYENVMSKFENIEKIESSQDF
jgi:hypothetical protein